MGRQHQQVAAVAAAAEAHGKAAASRRRDMMPGFAALLCGAVFSLMVVPACSLGVPPAQSLARVASSSRIAAPRVASPSDLLRLRGGQKGGLFLASLSCTASLILLLLTRYPRPSFCGKG